MRFITPSRLPVLFFLVLFPLAQVFAQGPGALYVNAGEDQVVSCTSPTGCVDLTADFLRTYNSVSNDYFVEQIFNDPPFLFNGLANQLNPNADDQWTAVQNLPFEFCFFGELADQYQVGSNGVLRFDVDPGDTTNDWGFDENLPNNSNPTLGEANIFSPVHDIDPLASTSEEIGFEVLGNYPNRVLVVSYYQVPMFSCNSLLATQMMVLYEFSNVIEIYMKNIPTCPSWNDGNAAVGIQNNDGNIAFVPPGRNTSDNWTPVQNEFWSFYPNPATSDPTWQLEWLGPDGTLVSNDETINVCPDPSGAIETYTLRVTYTNPCNGDTVVLEDEVNVNYCNISNESACDGDTITLDATTSGAEAYDWNYESPAGSGTYVPFVPAETNPTLDVTVSGSYRCEVTLTSALEFQETFNTGIGLECNLNGATTTYSCYTGVSGIEDGEYVVSNDSAGLNGGWHPNMEDHTVGDTNGRMLFVNADIPVGEFYRRTISLDPNTDYSFSAWISTVYDTDSGICVPSSVPSNVRFRIENMAGGIIQETVTGDIPNGPDPNWQEYFISFNTGQNSDIQLVLINNAPGGCGNDLVIDDISLTQINNDPEFLYFGATFLPQPEVETAPDDLFVCNNDGLTLGVFDLTSNEVLAIGTQDPAELNVFYFDGAGNPIADPTAHTITGTSETITIRLEELTGLCFAEATFDIVYTTVLAGVVDDLVVCDSDGNGSEPIDLVAEFDAQVLNGQPAGDFTISYHSTQAEANAGTNALTSPYNVATPFENIFVRFTSTIDPNCSDTNQNFIISVASPPIFEAAPLDLTQCSADVTIPGIFDLTVNESIAIGTQDPANIVVTYYDSFGSLISFPGAYTISGVSEVITMRLDNILGNCFNEATFVLTYTQALSGDVEDYNLCDLDGSGDEPIDLSITFNSQVLDGQPLGDYFITYHSSQLDADLSQNALPTPYVVNGPSEQIYVRLQNRQDLSCFDTAENFTIFLIPPPTPGLIDPFVVCDSDND
ncbi:MAG: hypothetical protein ACPGZQ_07490, partial [Flavobacteriaceae bacterium]